MSDTFLKDAMRPPKPPVHMGAGLKAHLPNVEKIEPISPSLWLQVRKLSNPPAATDHIITAEHLTEGDRERLKREWQQLGKPPIGIMPKWLWDEHRFGELGATIARYIAAGAQPLPEWIEEYNSLLQSFIEEQKRT